MVTGNVDLRRLLSVRVYSNFFSLDSEVCCSTPTEVIVIPNLLYNRLAEAILSLEVHIDSSRNIPGMFVYIACV